MGDQFKIAAPSWRPDIEEPACLVEEVVRIAGTDRLPSTPLPRLSSVTRAVLTNSQKRSRTARRALAGRGMVEAVTWSFIAGRHASAFGGGIEALNLLNPISTEMNEMRPSLLAGLVVAAQQNADRGITDLALFEVGQAYRGIGPDDQYLAASGVRRGRAQVQGANRDWRDPANEVDVFDAKADALGVLAALGFDTAKCQITADAPDWFHPGRSGVLRLGPKVILAHFGEIHPRTLRALDADGPIAAFEVFLDAVPQARQKASRSRGALDASDLMTVKRDFAFVVDHGVAADDLMRAARGADKELITEVCLFDVYQGEHVGEGKMSLAIEVTLTPRDKTLTDEEIDAVAAKVMTQVEKATGGKLRV
jgi:phenylalanyl-tRNA synthetase beta chain